MRSLRVKKLLLSAILSVTLGQLGQAKAFERNIRTVTAIHDVLGRQWQRCWWSGSGQTGDDYILSNYFRLSRTAIFQRSRIVTYYEWAWISESFSTDELLAMTINLLLLSLSYRTLVWNKLKLYLYIYQCIYVDFVSHFGTFLCQAE